MAQDEPQLNLVPAAPSPDQARTGFIFHFYHTVLCDIIKRFWASIGSPSIFGRRIQYDLLRQETDSEFSYTLMSYSIMCSEVSNLPFCLRNHRFWHRVSNRPRSS